LKRGHCQRFATGLVLMLRSIGIPARFVMGFRGRDSQEDGSYVVRHNHAHTWVEAIIRRRNPKGGEKVHWLTLDPTPDRAAETGLNAWAGDWWLTFWSNAQTIWRNYIVEYNADQQGMAATELWQQLAGDKLADGLRDTTERL